MILEKSVKVEIGYNEKDKVYFVYEDKGLRPIIFIGSYTQCLIVVGGISLGHPIHTAIDSAKRVQTTND